MVNEVNMMVESYMTAMKCQRVKPTEHEDYISLSS